MTTPHRRAGLLTCLVLVSWSTPGLTATNGPPAAPNDMVNFLRYDPALASAGQPTAEQLPLLATAGFERVIYLALTTSQGAVAGEDQLLLEQGLAYYHIPVDFKRPDPTEFRAFAALLQAAPQQSTLVHCQVNYRASAFSFLYRVLYQGVPMQQAKADMETIWTPDPTWQAFIFRVLREHGMDPLCDGCLWEHPAGS